MTSLCVYFRFDAHPFPVAEVPFDKEHRLSEEENFRHFDSNKDRILDEAEIEAWAMPSHTEAAEEEADHLIEVGVGGVDAGGRALWAWVGGQCWG